jgi:hypothetical protein
VGESTGDHALDLLADMLGAEITAAGPVDSPPPVTAPTATRGSSATARPEAHCAASVEVAELRALPGPPSWPKAPRNARTVRGYYRNATQTAQQED